MTETSVSWLARLSQLPAEEDWEHLNHVYATLLSGWCARAGVPESDRDDLVQEVLIVVVRRVNEFEHQHAGAFRGWLRAILANQLRHYFRKHAQYACRLSLDDVCQDNSHLSRSMDQEHDEFMARRAMRIAQKDFSTATWDAFRAQVLNGHSAAETAEQLRISVNAAAKAKCRVLKRIRQELQRLLD